MFPQSLIEYNIEPIGTKGSLQQRTELKNKPF